MSNPPNRFRFRKTQDGSPTVEILQPSGRREKMHNFQGAWSETNYVYGEALRMMADKAKELKVFSLGLGLGYNEILSAAIAEAYDVPVLNITSYETESVLKAQFEIWLQQDVSDTTKEGSTIDFELTSDTSEAPSEEEDKTYLDEDSLSSADFQCCYNWVLKTISDAYQIKDSHRVKARLQREFEAGGFVLQSKFDDLTKLPNSPNVLLYDAFSDKMNPELWDMAPLRNLLSQCARTSVFATYAAKGVLNRVLSEFNFENLKKKGFGTKRECTLALRQS